MSDFQKARDAFDGISIASYYGMEMRHQLATNPAALAAAESLLTELRKSTMLNDRIKDGGGK